MDKSFKSGGNLDKFLQQNEQQAQAQQDIAGPVQYPNKPQGLDQQINAMPNSEKLSGFERWVYKKLPGVSNSKIGQLLETFGKTPVGRALNYLDVLAEGAERTLGVVSQLANRKPGEDFDLKDAWKAGSLYYDVSNLPTYKDGHLQLESDLPGAYALVEARKMMQDGADFNTVRDTLYNNLGALKLRAQLQDTFGHVALDPLNFIGAALKPVEKLTAFRNLAIAGKVDVEAATGIAKTLRDAGKIEDALKVENAIADAQKSGKALTSMDKTIINLFGGAAYLEDDSKIGKALGSKYNPLALTPEAKTHELIDMAEKNVHAYLINNSNSPEEFIQNMGAVARGSVGDQWGHAALTPQGRVLQGVMNYADASVQALGQEWKLYAKERAALEGLSSSFGMDTVDLYKMAKNDPGALAKLIGTAVKNGQMTPPDTKIIEAISNIPSGVVTKEQFFANASALVEDAAAQIGIAKFGVSPKKFLTRLSDAVKKYETLAFIKVNPANFVRNALNNDITMIARGLYGNPFSDIEKYWKGRDIPPLLQRGFNVAGDGLEGEFDFAEKTISKVLNGENNGILRKAGSLADDIDLGIIDMSKKSQKAESVASLRASTNAYIDFGNQYWNPKTGFTSASKYLDEATIAQLNAIDPNLVRTLDDVVQSADGSSKAIKEAMQVQLESNSSSVLQAVEDNLGFKITDVMGPEITAQIQAGLPKAVREGKVTEFVDGIRLQMENHVDEMFKKHIENLPGMVSSYVQAGGPTQFSRIFSKAVDELWAGNTEHAIRMSTINELLQYAKETGDYKKVGSLWNKIFEDGQNHFGRVWSKMDAYEQGMKEGAKLAGIPYPKEISEGFSGIKNGWKDFFDFRNSEYKAFFEAQNSGKKAGKTYEQLLGDIDKRFKQVSANEDKYYRQIDDALAEMIPDKAMRSMYTRFRDEAAKLRENDRLATETFYQQLRTADAGEQPDMWQKFWQERLQRAAEIRDIERRGSAALQGDAQAVQQFAAGSSAPQDANTVRGLASQYGISTQTNNGVRMDNRVLSTIKKYANPTDRQIVENATIPAEVKTAFGTWDDAKIKLSELETNKSLTTEYATELQAAKKAEKETRKAYEDALVAAKIDKKMIQKLIKNKEFMNLENIPLDVAKQAFEARAAEKAQGVKKAVDKYFIPDAEKMWPEQPPIESAISEMNYGRSYAIMDNLAEEAMAQAKLKAHKISDLPQELQDKVSKWIDNVSGETTMFESARVEFAKMRRDSALLNYTRRNNFDNYLGHIAPFAFWTTHSMANWALHSIDRPAMLTSYMRYQKLLETSGLTNDKLPSRMKGHLRIGLLFAPKWMGDQFINPMGVALPFDAWQQPWEQMQQSQISIQRKTEQTLQDMLEKGVITEQEYQQAVDTHSGQSWDVAQSKAQEGGDQYDAMDFAQSMMTPHAPLLWAYNSLRGTPNNIGPFTPMSRTVKNVAATLGVDWNNSEYNVEAKMRKQLGLPAYDKWDDYRISREIANIATDGKYDMNQIQDAMILASQVEAGKISSKEAIAKSDAYKEASLKAAQEFAGGPAGTLLGAMGIPVKSYPEGEAKQRELQDQFVAAMKQRDTNPEALSKFFDDHPEYEARLALFKKPEERLKSFMIDNMWSRWNELPKVTKDEVKQQLGSDFANNFLSKNTQNYDAISPTQLQLWLKLTGGKQVGQLSATDEALTELNQLKLTDPETAFRVQTFYDMRNNEFDGWYEMQQDYYSLPEKGNERSKFRQEHPELVDYWNARRQWMQQNPDLVRFLTDDPKQLKKFESVKRNPTVAVPTAQEISNNISPANRELISQWANGQSMPIATDRLITQLAAQYGMTKSTLLGILTGKSVQ